MTRPEELLVVARETIGKVQFCFATTVGATGEANVRIIEPLSLEEDWSVAFVTSRSSRKAAEIEANGRLTLAYQHNPDGAYVALVGQARIDADPDAKRLCWKDDLDEWFPAGRDDSDAVVVRFTTERIELWSHARGIMPAPKGLRAAILVRGASGWRRVQA